MLVTCGALLVLVAQQMVFDEGVRAAILFLGGSMCVSVGFRVVLPVFDRYIADSCRDYYFKLHEEYIQSQQEMIKRMEEEITRNRKS